MYEIDILKQLDSSVESFDFLPKKLPLKKLGKEYKKLAGYVKMNDLARVDSLFYPDSDEPKLEVSLIFKDLGYNKVSLETKVNQRVITKCQRCANEMPHELTVEQTVILVVEKLDPNHQYAHYEQIMVNKGELVDLHQIIEDEVILSLPAVIKHSEDDLECKELDKIVI